MTQGIALGFLGAVLVRIAVEGVHVRYVADWMRWPVLVTGGLLVLLALRPLLGFDDEDEDHHAAADGTNAHRVPRVTWLLLLPSMVVFVVKPAGPRCLSGRAARRRGTARSAGQRVGAAARR